MMKKLFLSLLLLLALSGFEVKAREVDVMAMGVGKDYEWALMNALDNAVKQTNNVIIGRDAPMQRMEVKSGEKLSESIDESLNVNDGSIIGGEKSAAYSGKASAEYSAEASAELKEINASYKGFISSYDVISSEKKDDGYYYVKIKAKVKKFDDYESPDLIKKAKYSLSIVPFKSEGKFSCVGKNVSSDSLVGKIASILSEKLSKSKKFNVVDRENMDAYSDELSLVYGNLTKEDEKNRLRKIAPADYILVGEIKNFTTSKSTQNVPITGESYTNSSANILVSYKLLETATMEVITSSSVEENLKKEGNFSSCANVEKDLAKKVGNKIASEILTELFPDYKPAPEPEKKKAKPAAKAQAAPTKPTPIKLPFD